MVILYSLCPFSAVVVDRQLASLNSSAHLASDTVFIFPDGEVFLASRAVLAIQCSELTPLLYSREGRHVGKHSSLSSQTISLPQVREGLATFIFHSLFSLQP